MTSTRRNLLFPLLIIAVGVTMLLLAVGVLPEAIGDLMQRSWAALIVLFGFNLLLADRIRYGNWIAFIIVGRSGDSEGRSPRVVFGQRIGAGLEQ